MEQKKILWVVVSMSAFIVIIFGIALYLYAPFRNKSTSTAPEISDLGTLQKGDTSEPIDPVRWSRDPDSIPPLEKENPVLNISNNLTIVSGENAPVSTQNNEASVNVSDLAGIEKEEEEENGSLPDSLAREIEPETAKEPEPKKTVQPKPAAKPLTGVVKRRGTLAQNTVKRAEPVIEQKPKTPPASTVKKTPASRKPAPSTTIFWVQTASLSSRLNAENARDTLAEKHMNVEIFTKETSLGLTHRVRVGPFKNKTEAEYWLKKVQAIKGFEGSYIAQERKKA